jgi:hypothetical protein
MVLVTDSCYLIKPCAFISKIIKERRLYEEGKEKGSLRYGA